MMVVNNNNNNNNNNNDVGKSDDVISDLNVDLKKLVGVGYGNIVNNIYDNLDKLENSDFKHIVNSSINSNFELMNILKNIKSGKLPFNYNQNSIMTLVNFNNDLSSKLPLFFDTNDALSLPLNAISKFKNKSFESSYISLSNTLNSIRLSNNKSLAGLVYANDKKDLTLYYFPTDVLGSVVTNAHELIHTDQETKFYSHMVLDKMNNTISSNVGKILFEKNLFKRYLALTKLGSVVDAFEDDIIKQTVYSSNINLYHFIDDVKEKLFFSRFYSEGEAYYMQTKVLDNLNFPVVEKELFKLYSNVDNLIGGSSNLKYYGNSIGLVNAIMTEGKKLNLNSDSKLIYDIFGKEKFSESEITDLINYDPMIEEHYLTFKEIYSK